MLEQTNKVREKKPPSSLMYIAYHFPPALGSSGIHRTISNLRVLNKSYHCSVLTCSTRAYQHVTHSSALTQIPNIDIIRGWARSAEKSFSIKGKYFGWMAQPDNWQSWILGGTIAGIWHGLRNKPDVIISTYPIASAHVIGYLLSRFFRKPWVVDLRDPMVQDGYPTNPTRMKWFKWIESKIVKHASAVVLTTPGAQALYKARFPDLSSDFFKVIPNGYDEVIFDKLLEGASVNQVKTDGPMRLLHSGVIYPSERDPTHFFTAIAELKSEGRIDSSKLNIRLRACGHEALFAPQLTQLDINDIVTLEALIPFEEAVQEMAESDGLLLMQAANCNYQIPAKAYEYIRLNKPILALTPEDGDTGKLLAETGRAVIKPLDNVEQIKQGLLTMLENRHNPVNELDVSQYSRGKQAEKFAEVVEQVIKSPNIFR